uniref:Uncharacterized protein n=1 Tax=Oryza nivara TaxID=4536 RepID=A0A0E0GFZ3_ORYNI
MCLATVDDGRHAMAASIRARARLGVRAFYLRLSSPAPAELTLVYLPAIGGAALELSGRALPPAAPAEVPLRRVGAGGTDAAAYASADRVCVAEGARFEVYAAGKDLVADGVFSRRRGGGGGWRVECRRAAAAAAVAEVVVLEEGGALMRATAKASARGLGCGGTRLEGIPEEGWGCDCECGTCGDDEWEVVGDDGELDTPEMEAETLTWALEMGAWAVCVGVGLLATARRFRRKRAFW